MKYIFTYVMYKYMQLYITDIGKNLDVHHLFSGCNDKKYIYLIIYHEL